MSSLIYPPFWLASSYPDNTLSGDLVVENLTVDNTLNASVIEATNITADLSGYRTSVLEDAINQALADTNDLQDTAIGNLQTNKLDVTTATATYATQTALTNGLSAKANSTDVYLKTDTYTQLEVNNAISNSQSTQDSNIASTYATQTALNDGLSVKANIADVYTKTAIDNTFLNYRTSINQDTIDNTQDSNLLKASNKIIAYVADTSSISTPSGIYTGLVRWNNATQENSTTLFLSMYSDDGDEYSFLYNNIKTDTLLTLRKKTDDTKFQTWKIVSLGATSQYKIHINVSLKSQNYTFLNLDDLYVSFDASMSTTDLSAYSTTAQIASTYQPLSGMSSYLTTANASSTYQPLSGMSSYLTTANASSTYQPLSGMSSYLTTANASSTYQPLSGMSSYLTTANASSTYQPLSGMSSYLTTANALLTYAPISTTYTKTEVDNKFQTGSSQLINVIVNDAVSNNDTDSGMVQLSNNNWLIVFIEGTTLYYKIMNSSLSSDVVAKTSFGLTGSLSGIVMHRNRVNDRIAVMTALSSSGRLIISTDSTGTSWGSVIDLTTITGAYLYSAWLNILSQTTTGNWMLFFGFKNSSYTDPQLNILDRPSFYISNTTTPTSVGNFVYQNTFFSSQTSLNNYVQVDYSCFRWRASTNEYIAFHNIYSYPSYTLNKVGYTINGTSGIINSVFLSPSVNTVQKWELGVYNNVVYAFGKTSANTIEVNKISSSNVVTQIYSGFNPSFSVTNVLCILDGQTTLRVIFTVGAGIYYISYDTLTDTFTGSTTLIDANTSTNINSWGSQEDGSSQAKIGFSYPRQGSVSAGDIYGYIYQNTSVETYLKVVDYNTSISNYSTTTQMITAITNANNTQDSTISSTYVNIANTQTITGEKTMNLKLNLNAGTDAPLTGLPIRIAGNEVAIFLPSEIKLERNINYVVPSQTYAMFKVNNNNSFGISDGSGSNSTYFPLDFIGATNNIKKLGVTQIDFDNATYINMGRPVNVASIYGGGTMRYDVANNTIKTDLSIEGNNLTLNSDLTASQNNTITFNHFGSTSIIQATSAGLTMDTNLNTLSLGANAYVDIQSQYMRFYADPSGLNRFYVNDTEQKTLTSKIIHEYNDGTAYHTRDTRLTGNANLTNHLTYGRLTNPYTNSTLIEKFEETNSTVTCIKNIYAEVRDTNGQLYDRLISHNQYGKLHFKYTFTVLSSPVDFNIQPSAFDASLSDCFIRGSAFFYRRIVETATAVVYYQQLSFGAPLANQDYVNNTPPNNTFVALMRNNDGTTSRHQMCRIRGIGGGLVGNTYVVEFDLERGTAYSNY